jgi:hypothetical protein
LAFALKSAIVTGPEGTASSIRVDGLLEGAVTAPEKNEDAALTFIDRQQVGTPISIEIAHADFTWPRSGLVMDWVLECPIAFAQQRTEMPHASLRKRIFVRPKHSSWLSIQ